MRLTNKRLIMGIIVWTSKGSKNSIKGNSESERAKKEAVPSLLPLISIFIIVLFILIISVPLVNAQTPAECNYQKCTEDFECPHGMLCKGCPEECAGLCEPIPGWPGLYKYGVCKPCATSAECVKKTFEEAIKVPGAPSPWFVIAVVVCAIALMGAGIVYVIGHSFDLRNVKQIGRAELMQAIASLLLVALLFGVEWSEYTLLDLMETQTGIITAAIYAPEQYRAVTQAGGIIKVNPFEVSYAFMRKLLDCTERMYKTQYDRSQTAEWLSNIYLQFDFKIGWLQYINLVPYGGEFLRPAFGKMTQETEYLADEFTWLSILLYIQLAIMRFVESSMFTVFLPIGIILRAFPPTRGAGAVLIAIAIGMYIVYPLTYTLLAVSTPPVVEGCNVQIPKEYSEVKKECPISSAGLTSGVTQAQTSLAAIESDMVKVSGGATSIRYLVYIYFIIALGASFLFIRSISSILGADIGEIGRTMLKMM